MAADDFFKGLAISASGLNAEWLRMQVVANNVANAQTTRTPEGGPYRKQHVLFTTVMDELNGVTVAGVTQSKAPPVFVRDPDHPDANPDTGLVAMPDIKVPLEMIDLMGASRAYEANLMALRNFKQLLEEAIKAMR